MDFDIGTALNRTFSVVFKNPVTFLGVAALLIAASFAVSYGVTGGALLAANIQSGIGLGLGVGVIVAILVGLAINAVATGALVSAALAALRGRRIGIGEALQAAVPHIVPLVVINILLNVGVALGLVLLIVPGVFLGVKWSAALAARVDESTGIIDSFKRSWNLTAGAFWSVFGFLVVLVVASIILSFVVALPLGLASGTGAPGEVTVLSIAIQLIVNTLQLAFGATAMAAIYYGLRTQKEGDTKALEETFA